MTMIMCASLVWLNMNRLPVRAVGFIGYSVAFWGADCIERGWIGIDVNNKTDDVALTKCRRRLDIRRYTEDNVMVFEVSISYNW